MQSTGIANRLTLRSQQDLKVTFDAQSFYEIAALWINTMAVGITFYDVNPTAGYLIIPYLTWTTFAATINYFICRDNKQPPADAKAVEEKKIKDVTFT